MKHVIIGNRIPKKYFVTTGAGESDIQISAGSFDQALRDAGIENCNFLFYSSIMPKDAERVERKQINHGAVVEAIAAISNTNKGEQVTAGLIIGWVYNRQGEKVIGLVAEYEGHENKEKAKEVLEKSLEEMFSSRFDPKEYELKEREIYIKSFAPKKRFATALVAICFVEYDVPIMSP